MNIQDSGEDGKLVHSNMEDEKHEFIHGSFIFPGGGLSVFGEPRNANSANASFFLYWVFKILKISMGDDQSKEEQSLFRKKVCDSCATNEDTSDSCRLEGEKPKNENLRKIFDGHFYQPTGVREASAAVGRLRRCDEWQMNRDEERGTQRGTWEFPAGRQKHRV